MATSHLLVVDDRATSARDGISGPSSVCHVAEIIAGADEHCNWKLCDLVQKDNWWRVLAILLFIQGV
jgi:hypothetical protein